MRISRRFGHVLLLAAMLALLVTNGYWFQAGSPLETASWPRILLGGLLIWLAPGLALGELLGFRSYHVLETIAISFVLSLLIEILLLPVVLLSRATVDCWLMLLMTVVSGLILLLARRWRLRPKVQFLRPLITLPGRTWPIRMANLAAAVLPFALAVVVYQWGEDPRGLGGEKLLHMNFVRLYRDMPLELSNLGVDRGLVPPNLVHLWEFVIAGWTRLIKIDPLPLFYRARCVVPVLGLASMFLLVKQVFPQPRKTLCIFFGIALMCMTSLILKSPSLGWITGTDPTRGVMAFLGTAHHADSALDILVAAPIALGLRMFRRSNLRNALLLFTILTASFLWHSREFLQFALYAGIFGILIVVVPQLRSWQSVRRWSAGVGVMIGAAVLLLCLSIRLVPKESHGYDELALKRAAMKYAMLPENIVGVRNLFHFPLHFMLSKQPMLTELTSWPDLRDTKLEPAWQLDHWLMLSGLALIALAVLGSQQDRRLATYHFLVWFFALGWNFSMLVILALTYSEFYISTPRLLYLFSYLSIADALLLTSLGLRRTLSALFAVVFRALLGRASAGLSAVVHICALAAGASAMFYFGLGVQAWKDAHMPGASQASLAFSILVPIVVLGAVLFVRRGSTPRLGPGAALHAALSLGAFFLPLGWQIYDEQMRHPTWNRRDEVEWFGSGNPFGYSPELLRFVQAMPPGGKILEHPLHEDSLCAYSAQYSAIPPGVLIKDFETHRQIRSGEHVLLAPVGHSAESGSRTIDHPRAIKWLDDEHIGFVLVNKEQYDSQLRSYLQSHDQDFRVIFHRPESKELLVERLQNEAVGGLASPGSRTLK